MNISVIFRSLRTNCSYRRLNNWNGLLISHYRATVDFLSSLTERITSNENPVRKTIPYILEEKKSEKKENTVPLVNRLQNSRLRFISVTLECRASLTRPQSLPILPRHFYTRSRPFVRRWTDTVARVRKKYDCFAVYLVNGKPIIVYATTYNIVI